MINGGAVTLVYGFIFCFFGSLATAASLAELVSMWVIKIPPMQGEVCNTMQGPYVRRAIPLGSYARSPKFESISQLAHWCVC